jgi:chemotaxis signal transduction protein
MVDETARRRLIVEDLMKAGLSVRMISDVTDIPRSSVHRAMRAIARAEAKKQVAIAEIASELLGERLAHGCRGRR